MADYTFFTNPMSRGQIARWALHEAMRDYEQVLVDWAEQAGRVPRRQPDGQGADDRPPRSGDGDKVVTEAAGDLRLPCRNAPRGRPAAQRGRTADYLRWTFFAAGPVEQAIVSRKLKFEPSPEQEGMAGWGSFDRTMDTLEAHLSQTRFVCGERFTMADVYVGSRWIGD
jgi:glutathione S-transferase